MEAMITSATGLVAEAVATAPSEGAEAANPSTRRISVATSDCLLPPPVYIALPDFLDLDVDVLAVEVVSHISLQLEDFGGRSLGGGHFGTRLQVGVPGAAQIGHPTPHLVDGSLRGSGGRHRSVAGKAPG